MNGTVQDFVIATLKEMGQCPEPAALIHTYALSEGRLVAHKFRYEGGYAVWAVGSSVVTFYDNEGGVLKTLTLVKVEGEQAA